MDNLATQETENRRLRRIILCALFGVFLCTAVGCASSGLTPYAENPASTGVTPAAKAAPRKIVTNKSVISTNFGFVKDVAWSPDNKYFAVAQTTRMNASIVVYDAKTQKIVRSMEPRKCGPYAGDHEFITGGKVAFSPDGRYLAGGFGIITLWETKTWQPVRDVLGPFSRGANAAGPVQSIAFSPDSMAIAILYSSVIWPESVYVGGRDETLARLRQRKIDKSPDPFTHEAALMVFDVETATRRYYFKQEHATDKINRFGHMFSGGISYSPDGKYILTNHWGGMRHDFLTKDDDPSKYDIRLAFRDAKSGKSLKEISDVHAMRITASTFSHNGKLIATGTTTGSKENTRNLLAGPWVWFKNHNEDPIRIWDAATGAKLMELGPLRGSPKSLAFSPDDRVLVSCQTDIKENENIWLWDLTSGQLIERVAIPKSWNNTYSCAISPDGRTIAMTDDNRIIIVSIKQ